MAPNSHTFKLGKFTCHALFDNRKPKPLAEFFPFNVTPEELAAACAEHSIDPDNAFFHFNSLLVKAGEHTLLIDAGLGNAHLLASMDQAGFDPEDITDIYLTHADGDHVDGLLDDEGKPVFPNARIFMWQTMYDLWSNEANLEKIDYAPENFVRNIMPVIKDRVIGVELEEEFIPGVKAVFGQGHKIDHSAVLIHSEGESLLHVSDAIFHPLHAPYPDWLALFDTMHGLVVTTRRELIERSIMEKALVFAMHFPFPALGRFEEAGDAWRWVSTET